MITVNIARLMWRKFLVWRGFRSSCCGAKIRSWSTTKRYCMECGRTIV